MDIPTAARVCPYCRRDLIPGQNTAPPESTVPAAAPSVIPAAPAAAKTRWGRILLVVGAVLALPIVLLYCGEDHQRFLKFAEQRDAWHRKCDAYIGRLPGADPVARACQRELDEMTAYAKRQGWDK